MASTLYVMADRQGPATGEDRYALGRKDSGGSAGYQPGVGTEGVSRGATSWTIAGRSWWCLSLCPLRLEVRCLSQRLEDDAVLLCFLAQVLQLFFGSLRRDDVEGGADSLEANGDVLGDAERSGEIHLPRHGDLDAFRLYPHGLCDHLAGYLGTGCQRSQQKVSRTSDLSCTACAGVGFGLVDGAAYIYGVGDRGVLLARSGFERYTRRSRLITIPFL